MKILVLLPRFPYPLDKGDKLRAYHQMAELAKRHDVYLFALSHSKVPHDHYDHLNTTCTAVDYIRLHWWESAWGIVKAFLTGKPLQLGYWTSRRARKAYKAWERQVQPDVVYCQMVRTIPTLNTEHLTLNTKYILDFQDALSLNTRRRMEQSRGLMRLLLSYEYKALQRCEQQELGLFGATTVIAEADREAIGKQVMIVPNGVDTDYFSSQQLAVSSQSLSANRYPLTAHSIVFCGNMAYAPNVDAACWLVNEIMPLVWKQCPYGMKVLIAGADPKPAVRALAEPRVTVSGRLDDIRTAYASARIFVAPMRIGSGMQNKLLEAMAMKLPCITTTMAATPLGATPWEHLLVGDTAEQIADLIVKLGTEELHDAIADGGHRFVLENYSWSAAVQPLEDIFNAQLESK